MSLEMVELFRRYRDAMAMIETTDAEGNVEAGSAFHIGDGLFATAKHVLEGRIVSAFSLESESSYSLEQEGPTRVSDVYVSATADVALVRTTKTPPAWVPPGTNWDDVINDEAFYLARVLLMGYPPVPLSREPRLVAVAGEVNAVIDRYDVAHPQFVVSPLPRGGFSGGPAIIEWDFALGVISHDLKRGLPAEPGFTAVLSIEPLWNLLDEHGLKVSTLGYGELGADPG